MRTVASRTLSSKAKTFTGTATCSPTASWRGRVVSTMSGDCTATVFSALP